MARSFAPSRKPLRWRALSPDGVGHAFRGRGRALCGIANQEVRFDHPTRSRCGVCEAAAR